MIEGQLVVIQIHKEAHFVSLFPNMVVLTTQRESKEERFTSLVAYGSRRYLLLNNKLKKGIIRRWGLVYETILLPSK